MTGRKSCLYADPPTYERCMVCSAGCPVRINDRVKAADELIALLRKELDETTRHYNRLHELAGKMRDLLSDTEDVDVKRLLARVNRELGE